MARTGRHDNLRTPSTEQARERGRKGGLAAAAAKKERKTLRACLEILLERIEHGDDGDLTGAEAAAAALYRKALGGDVKAFEILRDTVGEKPTDKTETALSGGLVVKWQA